MQGDIFFRSHCSASLSFYRAVQLASCVTDISHNSVRLFICVPSAAPESPWWSRLWFELLAGCQALPCLIPAHIPLTVLLAKQSCLVLQPGALLGSYISFVPAQFLNLSGAQALQGWAVVFLIKLLICIPYSLQIFTLQLNHSLWA